MGEVTYHVFRKKLIVDTQATDEPPANRGLVGWGGIDGLG